MTSLPLTRPQPRSATGYASVLRGRLSEMAAWWSCYRTARILSGLDERTLKDIGAPVPGGACAAVEARVIRHLETLR